MQLAKVSQINIIGLGGIGSWLAKPLGRHLNYNPEFSGSLILIDGDKYSESNKERQDFVDILLSTNKAEAQAIILSKNFSKLGERIIAVNEYVGESNVDNFVVENSITFTCVDNDDLRHCIDVAVSKLDNGVHICGGNEEVFGQVVYFVRKDGKSITNPYTHVYPEAMDRLGGDRSLMSCDEIAQLPSGGQTICVNFVAAAFMLSYFNSLIKYGAEKNYYPCNNIEFDILHVNATRRNEYELLV